MKKILASFAIFILAFFALSVSGVSAKVLSNQKGDVTVAKNEIINDDLFVGAQTVEIEGVVNGDVFIGAQTVKITGTINGNLHVGAQTLDLSGTVKGNVYAGAQSVFVSGANIGGSLLAGGETISLDKDSSIGGSVITGGGIISIDSQVKRSVYAGTGNLTIGADAKIGKDLIYAANANRGQTTISPSAKIAGTIQKTEINTSTQSAQMQAAKKTSSAVFGAISFGATVISFIGALIVGLIFIKGFGRHFTSAFGFVSGSFWKSFGIGFLISIAFIPALIILALTIIGLPIAGLSILVFLIFSYFAKIVVGAALGNWLYQKLHLKASTYWAFALGLLVIYILKLIPVIGFLTGLTVFWAGMGALTLHALSEANK